MKLIASLLLIVSIAVSGCRHSTTRAIATVPMPGLSQPMRVSPEGADAAEPAIAAMSGGGYVAWVSHGVKSDADVMIARFADDGRLQSPPARVNSQTGVATAWRGDPPTVAVAPDQTVFVGWTARVESASGQATDLRRSGEGQR
jgi:hypothetical protein